MCAAPSFSLSARSSLLLPPHRRLYNADHDILVAGDPDLSLTHSVLSQLDNRGSKLTAVCSSVREAMLEQFVPSTDRLKLLEGSGASVHFDVAGDQLDELPLLRGRHFDRVILRVSLAASLNAGQSGGDAPPDSRPDHAILIASALRL